MTKPHVPRRHLPTSPFKAPVVEPIEEFALGDRVTHDRYGLGVVFGVEEDTAVLVDFGSERRRISSPYKGMNKL